MNGPDYCSVPKWPKRTSHKRAVKGLSPTGQSLADRIVKEGKKNINKK